MYLFYLDETGDHQSWNDQDNFALAGVAVHEGQVRGLSVKLDQIQADYFPGISVPIEFHAQHIRSGKGRYRHFPQETREELLGALYRVLNEAHFPNLVMFASAIHVSAVNSPDQALKDCLADICRHFNEFLVRQYKAGFPNKGLLIIDASGRDKDIRRLMHEFSRTETDDAYFGNIVDVPYFGDSGHTRMLQLADHAAYAVNRHLNHGDHEYLHRIIDRFAKRSRFGRPVGFRHLVGAGHQCSCPAFHGLPSPAD